jgi:hypothetical protein
VLKAEQLPAGVADLAATLTDVQIDNFAHVCLRTRSKYTRAKTRVQRMRYVELVRCFYTAGCTWSFFCDCQPLWGAARKIPLRAQISLFPYPSKSTPKCYVHLPSENKSRTYLICNFPIWTVTACQHFRKHQMAIRNHLVCTLPRSDPQ